MSKQYQMAQSQKFKNLNFKFNLKFGICDLVFNPQGYHGA